MARVDIHVFGSKSGYGTVAESAGIRADEKGELEQFLFGEISTQDAIARIETHASMTARMLRSGRVAVSRMLPAGTDDGGRPTVEVVTLVVDARTYETRFGALSLLANDVSFWRDARARAASGVDWPVGPDPSPDPRDTELLHLLDAWMHALRSGSVAILPESTAPALLRFVATLDATDRARCRWGIGINSLSAPVDICTMLPGASTHGARSVVRPTAAEAWHLRETEFAKFRASSGGAHWVPSSRMRPSPMVELESSGFDAESRRGPVIRTTSAAGVGPPMSTRQKRVMVGSMIAAGCSTMLLVVGAATYFRSTRPTTIQPAAVNVGQVDAWSAASGTSIAPPVVEPSATELLVTTPSPPITPDPPPAAAPTEAAPPSADPTNGSSSSTPSGGLPSPSPALPSTLTSPVEPASGKVQVYFDGDRDGFGSNDNPQTLAVGKEVRPRFVDKGGDCDDKDPKIYPGAKETCTDAGIDNDCNEDAEEVGECACKDADINKNGTKDCEEPAVLKEKLEQAGVQCNQLQAGLKGDLQKCEGGPQKASKAPPAEVLEMLTGRLNEVDLLLHTLYDSWKNGKFGGRAPQNRRDLPRGEDARVSCEWHKILATISEIRDLFELVNRFVPRDKVGASLQAQLKSRIEKWSSEYLRLDFQTWAMHLFTVNNETFRDDLRRAKEKCEKPEGGTR